MGGEKYSYLLLVGMSIGIIFLENNVVFLKNSRNLDFIWLRKSTSWYSLRSHNENGQNAFHPYVPCGTILQLPKIWKQSKCPRIYEIKKLCYKYTVEYYSTIENIIMEIAVTWKNLGIYCWVKLARDRKTNTEWYLSYMKYKET